MITSARLSLALSLALALLLAFKLLPGEAEAPERPVSNSAPSRGSAAVAHPKASGSLRLPPPPVTEVANVVPPVAAPTIAVTPLVQSETEPEPQVAPLRPSPAPPPAPSVRPLQAKAPTRMSKPMSKAPVRRPAPKDASAHPPRSASVAVAAAAADPKTLREGRTLLRLLEHGEGPGIEIAWPPGRAGRQQLFRRFAACFGMRLALVDAAGKLFTDSGARGRSWDLNLDRYSGFVRRLAGRLTAAERRQAAAIATRHGRQGALVRVFPRRVDALLLGGLSRLIGPGYRGARTIRARYRQMAGGLSVEDVSVDGRAVSGRIELTRAMKASCRRGGAA